ncbi:sugar ABC transporter substrate-binding protein [Dactylosporangium sp. NPDC049525]|uniref:sugar ABC transporter substrate-binding protein n=1 Tax=Dactylosporangium sp. NPDC049525 TaxID=3154730 RepID=UPI003427EABE
MRETVGCALGSLLLLTPAACTQSVEDRPATSRSVKIGFITKFPGDFYDTMVGAARQYDADHADVEVVYGQGKSGTDDESAIGFIEDMIAQHVDAIAITPTSPNVQSALDRAVARGIKVVLVDNDIPGWTGKSSVVATDNLAGGRLAGTWLAKQLRPGASLAVLQGRLGNPSLDDRVAGMKAALGTDYDIVTEVATDCDKTKGFNAAQDVLATHPEVTAIYSACGPPSAGALDAIKAANRLQSITLLGFDASAEELVAIRAGEQAGSVAQFPARMGTMSAEAAASAARGRPVQPKIDTGTELITKANVDTVK